MRIAAVVYILCALALIVGWAINIVKIIGLDFSTITGEHFIRIAGIFLAPVGGIAGYF